MSRRAVLPIVLLLAVVVIFAIVANGDDKKATVPATARTLTTLPTACHYRDDGALPDKHCTPGVTNKDVTQRTINKTVCVPGWTTQVRPPEKVTEPQKYAAMKRYGYVFGKSATAYEFDHLIPLELGGALDDQRDLWPEPHTIVVNGQPQGSHQKNVVANHLHRLVCSGKMKLAAARHIMRTDWRAGQAIP